MVQLWMSWCRLCAREDPSNTHINVLLKDEEGLPLADTITQCFSIDINNLNNLPKMICTDCYRLIRTNIILNQRIAKASAMFAELQVANEEEFDTHAIKARHNLECDFKVFTISPFENIIDYAPTSKFAEIVEQPIDEEVMHCNNKIIDPNPINIKMEQDETDNCDRLDSYSEESSHSSSIKTSHKKDTQMIKKQYKPRKERRTKNNTKPHYCSECHKGFMKLHNYRGHMQSAHDITIELKAPRIICENCGKEYTCISALKRHKQSHTDERKLKCKYCEKTFKGSRSLKVHEDTHNETNYICVVCGLKLNTQKTLRMHMVVHSDQQKHKCDYCGKQFKRAKALKNHLILHTGLKPYSCDFCDRTFACGANCRSHKKKNHPLELAAQEAAGKKTISKARIPKLRELKAVTASKAEIGKPNYRIQGFNEDAGLGPISEYSSLLTLKSEVPNDLQKSFNTESLVYEKSSPKQESDFFQGFFGKKSAED